MSKNQNKDLKLPVDESDSEMKNIPLNDEMIETQNKDKNGEFEESVRVVSGEIDGCCIIL